MGVSIAEEFEVRASPDRVFAWLIDPGQVVQCLPGAELLETQDDQTFLGRMRVKVGPVTASFRGRARFDEIDAVARRVRLSGEGQDTGGAGSAKLTMVSVVETLPNGASRVKVQSDVEVVGKLVQFGRGLMEEVSRQMFRQFAECVKAKLEAEPAVNSIPVSDSISNAPPSTPNPSASIPNSTAPTPVPPQAVSVLPLLWRALIAWLRRLFGGRG
ncbi:MAG: SRPBCC family protein [Gemmatimonadota bacterium]